MIRNVIYLDGQLVNMANDWRNSGSVVSSLFFGMKLQSIVPMRGNFVKHLLLELRTM